MAMVVNRRAKIKRKRRVDSRFHNTIVMATTNWPTKNKPSQSEEEGLEEKFHFRYRRRDPCSSLSLFLSHASYL